MPRFLKLGGSLSQARAGLAELIPGFGGFPWTGASADLDFVRRRYFWNGASRTEANFTTLVLNGTTFGAQGLDFTTATANPDITLALAAALNITNLPPVCYAVAGYFVSTPSGGKTLLQFDDGTNNERFYMNTQATPLIQVQTIDGGTSQSAQGPGSIAPGPSRFGICFSADTNDVKAAGNGIESTADTAATMPTVTTLRLGRNITAGTFPPAILSRLVIFTATKTQAEVNQLSVQIRDAA
jgi:hypothetical protein